MDIAAGLDGALLRRQQAHAEHAAEARAERHRDDAKKPAVDYGAAASKAKEDNDEPKQADPVATYDRTREREDPPHLVDVLV